MYLRRRGLAKEEAVRTLAAQTQRDARAKKKVIGRKREKYRIEGETPFIATMWLIETLGFLTMSGAVLIYWKIPVLSF